MIGIFGAGGFIGRTLSDTLAANSIPTLNFVRKLDNSLPENWLEFDFADPEAYAKYLDELTCAILLISASVPGTYPDNISAEIEKNVLQYSHFLASIQNTGITKIIYLSSGGTVYGIPKSDLIDEQHSTLPINPYGCAKLMIEILIKSESTSAPWDYTILRPSNPIGQHQIASKGQGLVAKAIHAARSGTPLEIWGDGNAIRDYFDARDLCAAIELCIENTASNNEIFNIGSSIGSSVNEVVDIVETVCGEEIKRDYIAARSVDVQKNVLNNRKLRNALGWRCNYSLRDSIAHIIENIQVN